MKRIDVITPRYVRRCLKMAALFLFDSLGGFALLRYLKKNEIIILMAHGVMCQNPESKWVPLRPQLDPDILGHTLRTLSKHYTFLSLSEAMEIIDGHRSPVKNGLVFTMDDGYRNQLTHALPICEQFGIVPTVYIVTTHATSQTPFWFDRLDFVLQQLEGRRIATCIDGNEFVFDNSSRGALTDSYRIFRNKCKEYFKRDQDFYEFINSFTEKLESKSQVCLGDFVVEDDWSAPASWADLAAVAKRNTLEIGSHTQSHFRLANILPNEIEDEVLKSKEIIETKLNIQCRHFCYPNGSYSDEAQTVLGNSTFKSAVTTVKGSNKVGVHRFELRRLNFPEQSSEAAIHYSMSMAEIGIFFSSSTGGG